MINYNTIISNFNKRGTLLKWLKTLNEAVENGALETVTTTTGEDYVIFHFVFADGTSVDSPAIPLEAGPAGEDATIEIGTVTTLEPGSDATVTNTGTSSAAVFNFGIPQGATGQNGQDGQDGAAATVAVGTVTTLSPGASATVNNSGTSSAAVFDFGIPQGATGNPGEIIEQIVTVEATTTASRAYATGDYFVNNLGVLVKATADIALGATIDSTNSSAVNATLADETAYSHKILTSGIAYKSIVVGNMASADYQDFAALKSAMPALSQCFGYFYHYVVEGQNKNGIFIALKNGNVSGFLQVCLIDSNGVSYYRTF